MQKIQQHAAIDNVRGRYSDRDLVRELRGILLKVDQEASFAPAQVLGKVDYMEGSVELTRNGERLRKVEIGTPVENLDLVKTSSDGLLSIALQHETDHLQGVLFVDHLSSLKRELIRRRRQGLSRPGSVSVPREARISSALWSST